MAKVERVSDAAFLVVFDEAPTEEAGRRVRRLHASLRDAAPAALVDLHPAYATVLVRFDPLRIDAARLAGELARRAERTASNSEEPIRVVEIPVRYGGDSGPDLDEVARLTGLSSDEVVATHAGAAYEVRFLGFSPGFPYLAGLPERLWTRRLSAPRRRVAAGSVAIAGAQAGIYPIATPGGWNVIGRTDAVLFDAARPRPATLAPGDRVRFVPVR
ncbi:MAG TPA: 5-oxoprolinase subunit PxpB [Candidatus Polarisedimenticolaceae bacterium]|nr:5-oxoprolinase subunit PxpB [Candidatus Polarisedimenticolaceae bacterium]